MGLLVSLAEKLNIPVFSEENINWAYSCFPNNHELYCGPLNPRSELISSADLFIGIGSKMFMPRGYTAQKYLSPDTKVIQVHPDLRQIGSLYPVHAGLAGSVGDNLKLLQTALRDLEIPCWDEKWLSLCSQYRRERQIEMDERKKKASTKGSYPNIYDLSSKLSELTASDAAIVNEAISSGFVLQDNFNFSSSRGYYGYTGGCLGWGVPAAMGIKLAQPDRQVIAFVGDGSFLFSCQALWTAGRYGIAVKVIVCNNQGYMAVKSSLHEYGENPESRVNTIGQISQPLVDFVSLSRSFGVPAFRVEYPGELQSKLEEVLKTEGPALLEVCLGDTGIEIKMPRE